MSETLSSVEKHIEAIALALITLDGDEDIPVMGEMLNHLNEIKPFCDELASDRFEPLVAALEHYLEKIVLRETDDFKPFELGLEYLQACFRSIRNQVDYTQDLSDVFQSLGMEAPDNGNGAKPAEQPREDKGCTPQASEDIRGCIRTGRPGGV